MLSRKWRTTTLVSSKTLLPGVALDSIRFRPHGALKVLPLFARHASGRGQQSGVAAFLAFGIKAVEVAGHFRELRRGKALQAFDDRFDNTHRRKAGVPGNRKQNVRRQSGQAVALAEIFRPDLFGLNGLSF